MKLKRKKLKQLKQMNGFQLKLNYWKKLFLQKRKICCRWVSLACFWNEIKIKKKIIFFVEKFKKLELEKKKTRPTKRVFTGAIVRYHSMTMPCIGNEKDEKLMEVGESLE